MSKVYKTAILTSKKNFSWQSMQEIIPCIEEIWLNSKTERHDVNLIDTDTNSVLKSAKVLAEYDNIVLTCFTVESALGVAQLRKMFGLKFKLFFYVHGMASIGCWPLLKWELAKQLTDQDVFVVTCEGDKKLIRAALPDITLLKHPFLNKRVVEKDEEEANGLVYIGRISEQKNLHVMFAAIYLIKDWMRENDLVLDIFGGEDNLGSPNMGKVSGEYENEIKLYLKTMEIEDLVKFNGFVDRSVIDEFILEKNPVFIAPSLHADENFGMSPFNILKNAGVCILTDWGGFAEYREFFPDQVHYIDIHKTDWGPFINPSQIARHIKNSHKEVVYSDFGAHTYYSWEECQRVVELYATKSNEDAASIEPSPLAFELLEKRESIIEKSSEEDQGVKNFGAKIFDDYRDKNAHVFLNGYCANIKETTSFKVELNKILPWAKIENDKVLINDPRVGLIPIDTTSGEIEISDFYNNSLKVNAESVNLIALFSAII